MHGCPKDGPAIYDEEDYNQDGYHRVTGLNRDGFAWTPFDSDNDEHNGAEEDDEDEDIGDAYRFNDAGFGMPTSII